MSGPGALTTNLGIYGGCTTRTGGGASDELILNAAFALASERANLRGG